MRHIIPRPVFRLPDSIEEGDELIIGTSHQVYVCLGFGETDSGAGYIKWEGACRVCKAPFEASSPVDFTSSLKRNCDEHKGMLDPEHVLKRSARKKEKALRREFNIEHNEQMAEAREIARLQRKGLLPVNKGLAAVKRPPFDLRAAIDALPKELKTLMDAFVNEYSPRKANKRNYTNDAFVNAATAYYHEITAVKLNGML